MPGNKGFDVNLDGRGPRTVCSTRQAADFLLHRWPANKGRTYMRAKFACLYALEGNDSDEAVIAIGN